MNQNNQREFFGIIVPIGILGENELSVCEKFVYSYVASYSKFCADSNAKIADRLGLSAKTVSRAIGRLQKLGYFEIKYGNANSASRKIFDLHKKSYIKRVTKPLYWLNCREERRSFPQSFAQLLHNAVMSRQNVQGGGQNVHSDNR